MSFLSGTKKEIHNNASNQVRALQTGGGKSKPCFSEAYNCFFLYTLLLLSCMLYNTSAQAKTCHDTAHTQLEMNICADKDARKEDQRQKEILKKLRTKISSEGQQKLKEAQMAFRVYRKAQCKFEAFGSEGGSVYPMVQLNCFKLLTKQHTDLLLYQLNCEEGNLGCGGQ